MIGDAQTTPQRGRITLTAVIWRDGDYILQGTGHLSGQEHSFLLSQVQEIIDLESGEHVNVSEFRAELEAHPHI